MGIRPKFWIGTQHILKIEIRKEAAKALNCGKGSLTILLVFDFTAVYNFGKRTTASFLEKAVN